MYTRPTLTNGNIKSIIINTIITFFLRFQLKEISKYNFAPIKNSIFLKIGCGKIVELLLF